MFSRGTTKRLSWETTSSTSQPSGLTCSPRLAGPMTWSSLHMNCWGRPLRSMVSQDAKFWRSFESFVATQLIRSPRKALHDLWRFHYLKSLKLCCVCQMSIDLLMKMFMSFKAMGVIQSTDTRTSWQTDIIIILKQFQRQASPTSGIERSSFVSWTPQWSVTFH